MNSATLAADGIGNPETMFLPAATVERRDRSTPAELFQKIYVEHMPIIWKTAHAFVSSREDQQDLVQEILVALWEAAGNFQHRAKLSTYVYRVAYHHALNWKRTNRRYLDKVAAFERHLPDLNWAEDDELTAARLRWLYEAINRLRPIEKTVCLLYLDGLSHSEMSDVLGISEANVGIRVHRCKQQLAKLLKQENERL